MTTKRTIVGFAIEGLGLDSSFSDGVCLYASNLGPPSSSATDYEWVSGLIAPPESVETSVNPFTGDWQVSSFTFEVSASARMASLLMHEQVLPSGATDATLGAGVNTIPYPVSGLDGEVIWIKDEAVKLGTYSSGEYPGSSRGHWGTTPTSGAAGLSVYEDATPYLEGRVVSLVEHDLDTGTERIRWRGLLRDVSMDGARVIVECEEILGALSRVQLNADSPNLRNDVFFRTGPDGIIAALYLTGDYDSRALVSTTDTYFQVGEVVVLARNRTRGQWVGGVRASDELEPGDIDEIYEIVTLDTFGALPEPTHPIAIAYSLLTSTGTGTGGSYDILQDPWALGLDYIDTAAFETAIGDAPGLSIDQLYLGWGGEAVDVLQVVQEKLLRPFGYFLTITVDGDLGLGRLRLLDVRDEAALSTNEVTFYADGPLVMRRAFGSASTQVVAEVGGTPFREPVRVTVRDGTKSVRRSRLVDVREFRLDFSVIDADRVRVTGREDSELANALVGLLQLGLDAAPRVRCRVADYTQTSSLDNLNLGAVVGIASTGVEGGWLLDNTGARVSDTSGAQFAGLIIGRRWSVLDHSYELELLLINFRINDFVRLRAPSGRVAAYDGSTRITLDDTAGLAFGEGATPGAPFEPGDELQFYARDGALQSTDVVTIDTVTDAGGIVLTAAPSTYTPVAGDYVRLAASKSYSNTAHYSQTIRPWAYLAPSDGDFEDADGSTTEVDVYGTAVFGGAG